MRQKRRQRTKNQVKFLKIAYHTMAGCRGDVAAFWYFRCMSIQKFNYYACIVLVVSFYIVSSNCSPLSSQKPLILIFLLIIFLNEKSERKLQQKIKDTHKCTIDYRQFMKCYNIPATRTTTTLLFTKHFFFIFIPLCTKYIV